MAAVPGVDELGWTTSSTSSSSNTTDSQGRKPKKSLGLFGSMRSKIKGIRSTSTSKPADAVTRSPSSSQRALPPFSFKQFSSLKKRHGMDPAPNHNVSRKAATVRCHGTERVVNVPRRTSMSNAMPALAPVKAPQLEIPKDIGGDFMLADGA
ncbi:uncharacterized protein PG986_008324 [Apiospora aurea]|uniref:Uncharacterized protein n=1 Tax=Apiospora aurea TaxID=335848 RepID=A0ABR1QF33_9PEZI